jgi:hypothetical protein
MRDRPIHPRNLFQQMGRISRLPLHQVIHMQRSDKPCIRGFTLTVGSTNLSTPLPMPYQSICHWKVKSHFIMVIIDIGVPDRICQDYTWNGESVGERSIIVPLRICQKGREPIMLRSGRMRRRLKLHTRTWDFQLPGLVSRSLPRGSGCRHIESEPTYAAANRLQWRTADLQSEFGRC